MRQFLIGIAYFVSRLSIVEGGNDQGTFSERLGIPFEGTATKFWFKFSSLFKSVMAVFVYIEAVHDGIFTVEIYYCLRFALIWLYEKYLFFYFHKLYKFLA